MKIALGSDHAGFKLKEKVKRFLNKKAIEFKDFGCFSEESCVRRVDKVNRLLV